MIGGLDNLRHAIPLGVRGQLLPGNFYFNRDSPDDSRSGVNVHVFPAFLQDTEKPGEAVLRKSKPI